MRTRLHGSLNPQIFFSQVRILRYTKMQGCDSSLVLYCFIVAIIPSIACSSLLACSRRKKRNRECLSLIHSDKNLGSLFTAAHHQNVQELLCGSQALVQKCTIQHKNEDVSALKCRYRRENEMEF